MKINPANQLTLLRLLLIPPFLLFVVIDNPFARIVALLIFGAASLTDYYDGKLARRLGIETTLGKFLDPLADKLLISTAFVLFVEMPEIRVPAWMVVLIIGREFMITGLRSLAASVGRILPAQRAGKFKTTSQLVTIILILFILITNSLLEDYWGIPKGSLVGESGAWKVLGRVLAGGPYVLVGITTIFTIVSGYIYLKENRDLLYENPPRSH